MTIAESAKLVVNLNLAGNFAQNLKASQKALGSFDAKLSQTSTRAFRAGQQIGTGIKNVVRIATVAVSSLGGLLLLAAKDGQTAANVQKVYAQAVQDSGKVSLAQVAILNAQQEALLNLAGVDDELIKAEQTRLIQMGLSGDQVARLTPLILDVAKATGKDLLTVTLAVGKAAEGNTTALARLGIIIPKNKDATKAYATTVAELNKRFGGTTQALSGSLDTRLLVLRERLANVRDEAGQKLLPVMTRIVDVVGQRLVPAFGEFINQILPTAIGGLDKLAGFLERGGATDSINSFLKLARDVAPAIQQSAEITGKVIGEAVSLFRSLPPEIQSLAVAGLAINKLTGGLVTNIAGGLIGAVLKQLVSGVVNVNGAVVNVVGAPGVGSVLPGLLGGAGEGAGALAAVGGVVGITAILAVALPLVALAVAGGLSGPKPEFTPEGVQTAGGGLTEGLRMNSPKGGQEAVPGFRVTPFDAPLTSAFARFSSTEQQAGKRADDLNVNIQAAAVETAKNTAALLSLPARLTGQLSKTVPELITGIRQRSAARYGGTGLGKSAVDATFVRDLQRTETRTLASSDSIATKIAKLTQIEADFKAHGNASLAREVGREIKALRPPLTDIAKKTKDAADKTAHAAMIAALVTKQAIRDKDLSVTTNIANSTSTYINGRLLDANLNRYTSVSSTRQRATA